MLGCEVEDIFHWAATGAISIYAEFYEHEFDPDLSVGFLSAEVYVDEGIPCFKEDLGSFDEFEVCATVTQPDGTILQYKTAPCNFDTEPFSKKTMSLTYGPKGFKHSVELLLEWPSEGLIDRRVYISGLWAIARHNINKVISLPTAEWGQMLWNLEANYTASDNPQENECMPVVELNSINVEDMQNRLRIIHEDMKKIQHHMLSGAIMPPVNTLMRPAKKNKSENKSENGRVTHKQCSFIAELLMGYGLTMEDFRGSTTALRQKITRKFPDFESKGYDDNTIRDWLKKAGVR